MGREKFLYSAEGGLHCGQAVEMFGAVVGAEVEVERSEVGRGETGVVRPGDEGR